MVARLVPECVRRHQVCLVGRPAPARTIGSSRSVSRRSFRSLSPSGAHRDLLPKRAVFPFLLIGTGLTHSVVRRASSSADRIWTAPSCSHIHSRRTSCHAAYHASSKHFGANMCAESSQNTRNTFPASSPARARPSFDRLPADVRPSRLRGSVDGGGIGHGVPRCSSGPTHLYTNMPSANQGALRWVCS
jgi:hypothetical protein